jgi:hypothetical protein
MKTQNIFLKNGKVCKWYENENIYYRYDLVTLV